jgi:hypothetical protein
MPEYTYPGWCGDHACCDQGLYLHIDGVKQPYPFVPSEDWDDEDDEDETPVDEPITLAWSSWQTQP